MSIYEIKTKTLERKAPLFKKLKYQPCILIKTRLQHLVSDLKLYSKKKLFLLVRKGTKGCPVWVSSTLPLIIKLNKPRLG
jgi:hypothetical protein